ncbi:transferase family [Pyrenophora seminiperda CCB06]|uniref:Transferase family n=1 Tax=Pyrenophora seminiperda CCB06 TaxID=1302712 RepID=A0A3M7MFA5_9PLEO|nr:transferase family [Pyrenophora seminiperda CCB06]
MPSSMDSRHTYRDGPVGLSLSPHQEDTSVLDVHHENEHVCNKILDIMLEHALNKFDDSKERQAAGRERFLSVINRFVQAGERVEACLPAFPFKSANKVYKVLGSLPDKAEELALERLNGMCARIKQVYKPGARVTIISDGITYNDLLSILDRETWAYGEALRKMAVEKKFTYIAFSRMRDLLNFPLPEKMGEITYIANCTNFRRELLNRYGRSDIDIDEEIANNLDTKLTYLGYRKFLESDLRHICTDNRGRNQYKRDVKYLAKQMLFRGYAFAGAVHQAYPNHLRLSIHESIGEHKLSISLLNTKTGYTTPWHCSVALLASGEWISAPMGEFQQDPRLELVYENGRPSYYKEKVLPDIPYISEANASYMKAQKLFKSIESGYSSPSTTSHASGSSSPPTPFGSSSPKSFCRVEDEMKSDEIPIINGEEQIPYGRRLIPQIMADLAATHPDRIVFSIATTSGDNLEFKDITAKAFMQAVDKTSWWLHEQVGQSSQVQPIGYIGPHDLRHILLTHACAKVGYATLNLSPKNSTKGALAVLEATQCNIWAKASDVAMVPLVEDFLPQRSMKLLEIPLLEHLLDAKDIEPFPYTKTFEEAGSEPFCYLHTSGSTGVPKPIPWTHELIGTMDAIRLLPPADGMVPWSSDWKEGDQIYSSFPMCHGAGIIMNILMPALHGLQCVLGPVGVIPNISLLEQLVDRSRINIWSLVPSLVDELGETPDVLAKFQSPPNKFICASGGPVNPASAGKVNDVIRVLNLTGTTEGLFIGNLVVDREDWYWFAFHPYSGFEFKEVEPGVFEHWVHRNEHASLFQGIFHTFPEQTSINFKDLYKQHPTKPNLWAFTGRNDDLIVLSSGYKIFPQELEALISTHPAIDGCLAIGGSRIQAGLLIELKDPAKKTDELVETIWSKIETAMSLSRHTGHFSRDYVIFTQPNKPFIRTDKRTIKRKDTLTLYEDYIERLYSTQNREITFKVDTSSTSALRQSVQDILATSFPPLSEASADDDLFALGLDSLGVSTAVKAIREATKGLEKLAPRHLYGNPTLAKFTAALESMMGTEAKRQPINSQESRMRQMIAKRHAHQSFRLNPFDYFSPPLYMTFMFYLPLAANVRFEDAFENLQLGLDKTLELIPALNGKVIPCSEHEIGYKKGELGVAVPPFGTPPRIQMVYQDMSDVLPSFASLKEGGFMPSALKDEQALSPDAFPPPPKDILSAQANFVNGGCILAVKLDHACMDGVGAMVAMKAWAENCRNIQGDSSATCEWYDPESFNHSLPELLHEMEGYVRPIEEIDTSVWDLLRFAPPEDVLARQPSRSGGLPTRYPPASTFPLSAGDRKLDTTLFSIPPHKLELLKQDMASELEEGTPMPSISDIVQALIWRSALRARYTVAKANGRSFAPDERCIMETPTDGRPYFSPLLPSTYMGSMLLFNRTSLSIADLCDPSTSILQVAQILRASSARMTPSLIHDAFSLLQSLPDYKEYAMASMGLDHMHLMLSNLMMFQLEEVNFGGRFWGNGGVPEMMRPPLKGHNRLLRFLAILPVKGDGGVEFSFGTGEGEREVLRADEEFARYTELVDLVV